MTLTSPRKRIDGLSDEFKRALGLLAIAGEPVGRKRVHECLKLIYDAAFTEKASNEDLSTLRDNGLIREVTGRGFVIEPELAWPMLHAMLDADELETLALAYLHEMPLRID